MEWAGEQPDRLEAHLSSQGYLIQTGRFALSIRDVGIGLTPKARKARHYRTFGLFKCL